MKKRVVAWALVLFIPVTGLLLVLYKNHEIDVFSYLAFNYIPSSTYPEGSMYMSVNSDEFALQVKAVSAQAQQHPDLIQQLVDSFEYEFQQEGILVHVKLKCDETIRKKLKIHFTSYVGEYDMIIP